MATSPVDTFVTVAEAAVVVVSTITPVATDLDLEVDRVFGRVVLAGDLVRDGSVLALLGVDVLFDGASAAFPPPPPPFRGSALDPVDALIAEDFLIVLGVVGGKNGFAGLTLLLFVGPATRGSRGSFSNTRKPSSSYSVVESIENSNEGSTCIAAALVEW